MEEICLSYSNPLESLVIIKETDEGTRLRIEGPCVIEGVGEGEDVKQDGWVHILIPREQD